MTQTQDMQHTQHIQHTPQSHEKEDLTRLAMAAESLLFVAGRPLTYPELRKLLDVHDRHLMSILDILAEELESQGRGIRLQRMDEQAQLVTAPENARYIAALLGLPMTAKLTTAAMETLAVVSYRQPITRAQIEAVRGVNSDRALASLIQHGLVAEVGRAPTVGRPALFATTPEFLHQFGLTSLQELPHVNEAALNGQNGHQQHPEQEDLAEQDEDEEGDKPNQHPEQGSLFEQDVEGGQNGHAPQTEQESQPERAALADQNGHGSRSLSVNQDEPEDQRALPTQGRVEDGQNAARELPAWAQNEDEPGREKEQSVQEYVEDEPEDERELPAWAQDEKEN